MEDALSDLVRDINKLRLELTETREAAWSLVLVSLLVLEADRLTPGLCYQPNSSSCMAGSRTLSCTRSSFAN